MSDSLIANYWHERLGGTTLFIESSFVCYRIAGPECFIMEMFVAEDMRSKGKSRELVKKLEAIAKHAGCEIITGNIHVKDKGSKNTLRAALKIGFDVIGANNNVLLISKSIIGGE